MASSARFFSNSIFSALRLASAAAASASAAALAAAASSSSTVLLVLLLLVLSESLSHSVVGAPDDMEDDGSPFGGILVSCDSLESLVGMPSTCRLSSNMLASRRRRRLGILLKIPTVIVPSTITSKPSNGSMGGGWTKPLPEMVSTSKKFALSLEISNPRSFICFCIESARFTNANATVLGSPVPPASPTDVNVPTINSSLLPRAYRFCPGRGSVVKFSTSDRSPRDCDSYKLK
mmetsp:Transcript_14662/g.26261  ORF Transcript_14662/g.26261 Transcript_14662/m.26261 type:complete len:234 (-) Transcript_14662:638-1339(-)